MGQHTWFYKSKKLYKDRSVSLDDKEAPYHDCFRTFKREADGEYTRDVIYSKEECDTWLKENAATVHDLNQERVDEFWEEFPDGVIDFG